MLNEKEISQTVSQWETRLRIVTELERMLPDWKASLEQGIEALKTFTQVTNDIEVYESLYRESQLAFPGMGLPHSVEVAPPKKQRSKRRKGGRKSDVQIIEEIFREYGPLHVTDLVSVGPSKGVPFTGSKKSTLMARDKMYGSKRFYNFGNNVWGLPSQELPERYKRRGRGNRPLNGVVHAEAEQDLIRIA